MPIPLMELVNKIIREKNEKKSQEYQEKGGQTTWHISSFGSCLRGVYFQRLNPSVNPFTDRELRVFHKGNMEEEWLVSLLQELPEINVETQVAVKDEKYNLSGKADAVISYENEKEVLEVKSKHSKSFWYMINNGEGANLQHKMQIWWYLYLLNIEKGRIVYLSKDDCTVHEFPVFLNENSLREMCFKEADLLNDAWNKKDPSILPIYAPSVWQSTYCKQHEKCLEVENNKKDLCLKI